MVYPLLVIFDYQRSSKLEIINSGKIVEKEYITK